MKVPTTISVTFRLLAVLILSHWIVDAQGGNITVGVLLPFYKSPLLGTNGFMKAEYFASAVRLAVDTVNRDNLIPSHYLDFVWNDTNCDEGNSLKQMSYQRDIGVSAFIGPGCSCTNQAKLASFWNMPMLSYVSSRHIHIRDNSIFTRVSMAIV